MRFFQTLAEGGQTWSHRVRMVRQVLKTALALSFLISIIYLCSILFRSNPLYFQSGYYYIKAHLASLITDTALVSKNYLEKMNREKISTAYKDIPIERILLFTKPHIYTLQSQGKDVLYKTIRVFLASNGVILIFFLLRGTASKKKQHIGGKKRIHPKLLQLQLTLKRKASSIKIGTLPLVKGTETQHILITGGTGSGKTNCIHEILQRIRQENQKTILIDTTQTFVKKYYDPTSDIILNPFDERSAPWHPWIECQDRYDYDTLAESFIPHSHHDHENYWRTASRSLLSSILQKTKDLQRTSELSRWILYEPLIRLAEFVEGTRAAAHIDIHSEKTAASIRSVASSFLACLEYLQDTEAPFSIKKWIQNEEDRGWLFLSTTPSQRSSLNPLLSTWFSVGVRSLLQLEPSFNRRVWFVIDELPSLQKLKDLESFVTESRKYGGCGLFALQSPAQLEDIYGRATTQTIFGNCATRAIFAEHDPEIARLISKSLGESEVKEYQEGISYGAHEVRDGVSLSLQTKNLPVVSATEIQSLEPNTAFVKLSGNHPVARVQIHC